MAKNAVQRAKVAGVPATLNSKYAEELAALTERLNAPSGDRITCTQSKQFQLPDGTKSGDPLRVVIVDFCSANYYYDQQYQQGVVVPPRCFALSLMPTGMGPHENSPDPQSDSCAACWANQFNTNGKGKACSNTRLLAVLEPNASAESPLLILKVSATALKAFDAYVSKVARMFQRPVRGVITTISFAEDVEYASLRFTDPELLDGDIAMIVEDRLEEARKRLLTAQEINTEAEQAAPPKRAQAKAPPKAPPKALNKPAPGKPAPKKKTAVA